VVVGAAFGWFFVLKRTSFQDALVVGAVRGFLFPLKAVFDEGHALVQIERGHHRFMVQLHLSLHPVKPDVDRAKFRRDEVLNYFAKILDDAQADFLSM
jgi:hypothetical protein